MRAGTGNRKQETEPCQTGLRRRGENCAKGHREATVTAPVLDSTHKIYLMLKEAFDGPPICISRINNMSVVFIASNDSSFGLPASLLQQTGLKGSTETYADPRLRADVSTDDWPFFYMPRRVYPVSYLVLVALIAFLSTVLVGAFSDAPLQLSLFPFFLLGVGFMLIETKGITELGLVFGNSWQVIGVVIAGVLVMAFLANWVVQVCHVERVAICYVLLLLSLLAGWFIGSLRDTEGFHPTG